MLCIADNVNSFGKPVSIQVRDVFNWAFQLGEKPITVARQAGTDGYQFSLPHVNRLRHFRHGRRLAAYVAHLTRGGDPDATFLRQLRRARLQMMEFSPSVLSRQWASAAPQMRSGVGACSSFEELDGQ